MNPLIIIDLGHGGADKLNKGHTGYIEADGVLDIGLRLKELLVASAYDFKMTREKDETVELYDRSMMANSWQGDILISLHTNAGPESANGIETFHTLKNEWGSKHSAEAKRVADIMQKNLVLTTGLRDRGTKTRLVNNPGSPIDGKDYYAVIRRSNMPAIIIEMGFHTNRKEEELLKSPGFRELLAKALLKGIKEAYPLEDNSTVQKQDIKLEIHGTLSTAEGIFFENKNYVPITLLRQLGYKVEWDEKRKIVTINYK